MPLYMWGTWPIKKGHDQSILLQLYVFSFQHLGCSFCPVLAALGFGSSLPFRTEKRLVYLHESEESGLLRGSISRGNTFMDFQFAIKTNCYLYSSDVQAVTGQKEVL
jgi:hypothetical protein